MELETQIMEMDESALDNLFNETPASTPSAEDLVGGKKPTKKTESQPAKKQVGGKEEKIVAPIEFQDRIDDIDLDKDFEDDDELEEETPKTTKKQVPAKKASEPEEEETEEEVENEKEPEEPTEEETEEEGGSDVKSVLKSTVDYLIQSGLWQDFEGREELDVDEDTYARLVAQQDSLRVNGMFEELVDSTGPFGKAIIDYVKNGGSPDEIIDLFKEQKQIESIPTESIDGQKEIVKHYYSEVLGWKPEKIEKYISGLVLSNELENEAKETKELFGTYYKKEADRLNKEQNEYNDRQKEAEQAFENNIRSSIKDRKDLSLAEKRTIEDYLLNYDQRLPNGNLVNKFYVNFAKMQANPQDYIDLVQFVMDKGKYVQKISTQEKTKAAADAFKFIKGNGAVSTKKGSSHSAAERKKGKEQVSLNWGLPSRD